MARQLALVAILSLLAANAASADPLVERAHHKKVAAAALIGVGLAAALAGQILLIVAAVDKQFYGAEVHCGPPGCGPHPSLYEPFAIPGGVLVGVGAAMLITGIPLYAVGGTEMRRAKKVRPTLSFAPQLGRDSGSLVARLRF